MGVEVSHDDDVMTEVEKKVKVWVKVKVKGDVHIENQGLLYMGRRTSMS